MRINVHAGHNPDGKAGCGAVGIIRESTEARNVKNEVIRQLKALGHTVYDCTVDDGAAHGSVTAASDVLTNIVKKCNAHSVDLDVSIHFNSNAKDTTGDGETTGTEVYICTASSKAKGTAENICKAIAELGFKNRGVKVNGNLYVLRKTTAPAVLVECCFVDDKDDVALYDSVSMASAIVYGITGQKCQESNKPADAGDEASTTPADTAATEQKVIYRVQVGAYSVKANAEAMQKKLKAAGFDNFMVKKGGLYKIQVGAYSVKANAEAMQKKLKAAGFDAIIVKA